MVKATTQEKFRAAVSKLLRDRKVTQIELARRLGVSKQHINNILKGRRIGTDELREKIADFFGLSVEELLLMGAKLLQREHVEGEPFPHYQEIMSLPRARRFDAIVQVAKEQVGCSFVAFPDSVKRDYEAGRLSEEEVYEQVVRLMEKVKAATEDKTLP